MAYADQCAHFRLDLLLGKFLAGNRAVLGVVRAIYTAVYAIVRQVKRGEEDYAVAVEFLLDFPGEGIYLLLQVRVGAVQQDRRLTVAQPLAKCSFLKDLQHAGTVGAFARGRLKGPEHSFVVYESVRVDG